nr:nicotinamide mononucleotide transporter family protein [Actinomadura macra]
MPVRSTTPPEWAWLIAAGAAGTGLLTWVLSSWTDSTVPFWDALTTALSLMLAIPIGQFRMFCRTTSHTFTAPVAKPSNSAHVVGTPPRWKAGSSSRPSGTFTDMTAMVTHCRTRRRASTPAR